MYIIVRLATILEIMFVSTFKTAVILYVMNNRTVPVLKMKNKIKEQTFTNIIS
jgi:hypothetical protein